jgi:hypothetical protein
MVMQKRTPPSKLYRWRIIRIKASLDYVEAPDAEQAIRSINRNLPSV